MRTPLVIIAVLIVVLLGISIVFEDEDAPAAPPAAPLSVIAHRVEDLRDLKFKELPKPVEVTGAQAKLFVKDLATPALVMPDLKSGERKGRIALTVLT